MPRQNIDVDLIPGKIRKRGCSSSVSSSSSILQNYRFKRAVLVGKRGGSYTPVPTWRLISSRSRSPASASRAKDSPASQSSGRKSNQAPVSARKLAATLWEINEIPLMEEELKLDGRMVEELKLDGRRLKKELRGREISAHSPVSERIDRSATGSRCRGTPSMSKNSKHRDHNIGGIDFVGEASVTEVEHRSRTHIPIASSKGRLKDISNALTTSKELVKIINRVWRHEDWPSSSMSLISALHAELERGRSQVNQLIQDQRSNQNDMNHLMKRFAEEKAAWKSKEKESAEAAIEAIAGDLEAERKLRRRFESFNKKLGRELAETKLAFLKLLKEHESEKRAREIIELVCEELARGIESEVAVHESKEVNKNSLFRENAYISEANYKADEKSAAVEKLRNQLESALGRKRVKQNKNRSNYPNDVEISGFVGRNHLNLHQREESDDGEVENRSECLEDSGNSDIHSVELNIDNNTKGVARDRRNPAKNEETKSKKGTFLRRSISEGVEWGIQAEKNQIFSGDKFEERSKFYGDEYKSEKSLRERASKGNGSPTRQWGEPWPPTGQGGGSKSRLIEVRGEGSNPRKANR